MLSIIADDVQLFPLIRLKTEIYFFLLENSFTVIHYTVKKRYSSLRGREYPD